MAFTVYHTYSCFPNIFTTIKIEMFQNMKIQVELQKLIAQLQTKYSVQDIGPSQCQQGVSL
jgi:hypothetical protein